MGHPPERSPIYENSHMVRGRTSYAGTSATLLLIPVPPGHRSLRPAAKSFFKKSPTKKLGKIWLVLDPGTLGQNS